MTSSSDLAKTLAFEFVILNLMRQLMRSGALSRSEIITILEESRLDARWVATRTQDPQGRQLAQEIMDYLDEMKEFPYWQ